MYLDTDKSSITRVHSQKFAMGAEPQALKNFAFFCKNNLILGLFGKKIMLLKRGIEIGSAKMIKLIAKMGHMGGG